MMDMLDSEKEMILFQSLIARKGMQYIVDTAAQIFGNPLFVCDLGYKILCCSSDGPADDPFWTYLREHNYSMPEPISQLCVPAISQRSTHWTSRRSGSTVSYGIHSWLPVSGMDVM